MLKVLKFSLILGLISSINVGFSQANCSELFFSEYIKGSSNNKAVEIYNPTNSAVDLSTYSVKIFSNGNMNAGNTIQLIGMLQPDSVFVLTHTSAVAALKDSADLTSGSLGFNGDDAVALVSATDTVDVIGVIGTDPGTEWIGSGVSTLDQTLIRMASIQVGIGPDSSNFDPSLEWNTLPQDDFSNIGIHSSSCHLNGSNNNDCTQLFFSEYIEGDGLNKGLEIYNPSTSSIDLSTYSVKIFTNGSPSASITIPLSGMLAGNNVYVLTHSGANNALKDSADLTSGSLTFNGDDAVALVSSTDTVDVIGVIGTDPGLSWSGGGVSTLDETLIRFASVKIGIGNDSSSFNPSIQWTSLGLNDYSNIGIHTSGCHPTSCTATSDTIIREYCAGETVTLNGVTIATTGFYYDSLQSVGGCDSVFVYDLRFNNAVSYTSTVTIDNFGSELEIYITDTSAATTLSVTSGFPDGQSGNTYTIEHCLTNPCVNYYLVDAAADGFNSPATVTVTDASNTTVLQILDTDFNNDVTGFVLCNSTPCTATSDTIIREYCAGETVTLNGVTIATSGFYYDSLQSVGGCDSVFVYDLRFNNAVSYTSTVTIDNFGSELEIYITDTSGATTLSVTSGFPDGQSGNTYTIEHCLTDPCVNYYLVDAAADGFNSPATVTVTDASNTTVLQILDTDFNNDVTGFVLCNSTPCTATSDTIIREYCAGETVTLNGVTIATTGFYYDSLQSVGGCDSVFVYDLRFNNAVTYTSTVTIDNFGSELEIYITDTSAATTLSVTSGFPDGQSGNTYTIEHCLTDPCVNYYLVDAAADGFNSPATVTVTDASNTTVLQILDTDFNNDVTGFILCNSTCSATSDTINESICMGDSYAFASQTITTAGIYYDSLLSVGGCDSVTVLSLIVNPLPTIVAMVSEDTVCSGADVILYGQGGVNYIWDNNVTDSIATTVTQTTTYTVVGEDANGCVDEDTITVVTTSDSVPEIIIFTADSMLCQGEGTSFSSLVANAGQNVTYQWMRNGNNVGTGLTTYNSQSTSTNNGDVITCEITTTSSCVTNVVSNSITISVGSPDNVSVSETICQGDTVILGSQQLTVSGTYSETLQNINGCDSVVNLELTVNPTELVQLNETICEGANYQFSGSNLEQAGTYVDSLQTTKGCDSIVTLVLVVKPIERTTLNEFICSGESFVFGGNQITTSGTYADTLTGVNGCDSITTLELIVGATDTLMTSDIICSGDSVVFGSQTLMTSGIYTEAFTSTGGCDSVVSLELVVVNSTSSQITETICGNGSIEFAGQTLNTSGVYYDTILNQAGCDSVIEFTLVVNDIYQDTLLQNICSGDDITFGGVTYNQTGQYVDSLQTVNGCDSIVYLDLTVVMPQSVTINESICNGSSYVLGTQTITQAGTYTELFQSSLGCDSTVTAIIGIGNSTDTSVLAEICQGEFYEFGGQVLTSTGTYTETFQNDTGCDSVVTLTLSVKVNPIVSITQTGGDLISTEGDAYQWFFNGDSIIGATDQVYMPTENGIYTVEMTAFNGCSDLNNYTFQNVSIEEALAVNLTVVPNPSLGQFRLTASSKFTYVIYNVLGEIVTLSNVLESIKNVDLTAEENGVYILKVMTENNDVIIERLVKH
jgi:hypothetical protein